MTPGGNVRFSYFCRSHIDHFCKIILISDNWFQMRFLKVFLCHNKPPPLVAMFLMDQIRFSYFCRWSRDDYFCHLFFHSDH